MGEGGGGRSLRLAARIIVERLCLRSKVHVLLRRCCAAISPAGICLRLPAGTAAACMQALQFVTTQ
jgi:hypothetical protein